MEIEESSAFRVTRDADLEIDDQSDDLLQAMETELRRRRFGDVVRLELNASTSPEMREQLIHHLGVTARHVYSVDGLLDCADLSELVAKGPPELLWPEWPGITSPALQPAGEGLQPDIFAILRGGDVLVHHPYERSTRRSRRSSEQAVDDPDVLAIKQTLYRTSGDSPDGADADPRRGAGEAGRGAGRAEGALRRGAQHRLGPRARAARAYTSCTASSGSRPTRSARSSSDAREAASAATSTSERATTTRGPRASTPTSACSHAGPDLAADVADLFNYLTGFARPRRYRKLLVAPLDLRERILAEVSRVRREPHGRAARPHRDEDELARRSLAPIEALYAASQAGVRIDLIVRGICCLRPGVPGLLREHPRESPSLGRFLEHERVFQFTDTDGTRDVHGVCRPDAAQPRCPRRGRDTGRGRARRGRDQRGLGGACPTTSGRGSCRPTERGSGSGRPMAHPSAPRRTS